MNDDLLRERFADLQAEIARQQAAWDSTRERLNAEQEHLRRELAAALQHAHDAAAREAKHQAATARAELSYQNERAAHLKEVARRERVKAAIARVRELHEPSRFQGIERDICRECSQGHGALDAEPWPCDTIRALGGEDE